MEVFKNLGRLFAFDDNNIQAVQSNLKKACGLWARVSHMVQAVILFTSETWNLSHLAMQCLEGFHLKVARRMTGMVPKKGVDGTWYYPSPKDALDVEGLHTIKAYINVQRQTIASFIVNQSIFNLCQRGVRRRGSSPC